MKNNLLKYILVVSLLLNFSLLGAAGYSHYQQSRHRSGVSLGTGGLPGRTSTNSPGTRGNWLFEELSLKPEQIKLFQQRAIAFHSALDKERQEVGRLRKSLFGLMRADDFDHKAIDATIVRINGRQQDMQKMVVAHMIEFKGMLAKDQQKKFFDLIEQAMTKRGEMQCQ
jgi:Spy/CpxP family protein refolding chaperone